MKSVSILLASLLSILCIPLGYAELGGDSWHSAQNNGYTASMVAHESQLYVSQPIAFYLSIVPTNDPTNYLSPTQVVTDVFFKNQLLLHTIIEPDAQGILLLNLQFKLEGTYTVALDFRDSAKSFARVSMPIELVAKPIPSSSSESSSSSIEIVPHYAASSTPLQFYGASSIDESSAASEDVLNQASQDSSQASSVLSESGAALSSESALSGALIPDAEPPLAFPVQGSPLFDIFWRAIVLAGILGGAWWVLWKWKSKTPTY